jgi:hypothetical protein
VNLEFSVYRDLSYKNLVFYTWHVRGVTNFVPGPWRDRGLVYYGNQKDWLVHTEPVGDLLDLATATHVQVALGAWDMCNAWCGIIGSGACHSHAPLIDTVELYRIDVFGPQWSIRDMDQFQDNFPADGSTSGCVRADMAADIRPVNDPSIQPGDSAVVTVSDPESGIADDFIGGKKIYIYVAVWPLGQPGKTGAALTEDPVRFPFVGTVGLCDGIVWTCLRLDSSLPGPDSYCIDLNDCLFEPGDTVCYFYCAENNYGVKTYAVAGRQGFDPCEAAANAYEFTCLPAGGWNRGGDILYVDGMDGRDAQPYFDTAFQLLGLEGKVDRYDVRAPSSAVGNRPGSRVRDIGQLLDCYRKILWDCGDLEITLGDGSGTPEKSNDYCLLNEFLGGLPNPGGVYLCGDDVPSALNAYSSVCAVTFRATYISYSLTTPDHRPTYGVAPKGVHKPAGCFGDDIVIYGGCPLVNDFDVMTPTGASMMEVSYGVPTGVTNSAIISEVTNNGNAVNVGVILSGFSFIYVRDDENDGILDRVKHMHDIITWLGNIVDQPTDTGSATKYDLSQNYPNPFNPQTTIAFSLKNRGHVSLNVYNVAGELVRTLVNEERGAGSHKKEWDGRDNAGQEVSSGVYFYKLVANSFSQTKKMVLLK